MLLCCVSALCWLLQSLHCFCCNQLIVLLCCVSALYWLLPSLHCFCCNQHDCVAVLFQPYTGYCHHCTVSVVINMIVLLCCVSALYWLLQSLHCFCCNQLIVLLCCVSALYWLLPSLHCFCCNQHVHVAVLCFSPALVIAFIMQHFQLSPQEAYLHVQKHRFCICLNQGFVNQLKVSA